MPDFLKNMENEQINEENKTTGIPLCYVGLCPLLINITIMALRLSSAGFEPATFKLPGQVGCQYTSFAE